MTIQPQKQSLTDIINPNTSRGESDLEIGSHQATAATATAGLRRGFATSLGIIFVIFFTLLAIFAEYATNELGDTHVSQYFYALENVLIMVFLGIGLLMSFLRRFSLSAISLNFILSCVMMLGAVIAMGWVHHGFGIIHVDLPLLIEAAFCAATGMISLCVLIGFTSPTQIAWLMTIEVPIYAANYYLVIKTIGAFDVGGSITLHVFAAFFGLGASFFLSRSSGTRGHSLTKCRPSYTSNVLCMIGTIFLWVYWPSFNGALASVEHPNSGTGKGEGPPQHQIYVIMNTIFALIGGCIATFIISAAFTDSLDPEHIQNSTLAGAVAIGTAAALHMAPAAALGIGFLAGTLSTLGFIYLSPIVERYFGIYDTCGVLNLHAIPGIVAAIASSVLTSVLYTSNEMIMDHSKSTQAGLQMLGLVATIGVSTGGGLVGGYLTSKVRVPGLAMPILTQNDLYEDALYWHGVEKEE